MSSYEWESGTIIIPTKEWSKFRTALITEWNNIQKKLFNDAFAVMTKLKAQYKGKRNVNWNDVVYSYAEDNFGFDIAHEIYELILPNKKLVTPKKKDLKILPISKSVVFHVGDNVTISLKNERRIIEYHVSENNHACESAHQLPMVRKLFYLLGDIKWTRGSGGDIIGNDEFNRDNEDCGGGGNYIKRTYGSSTSMQLRK
jgi:hypothetical protein